MCILICVPTSTPCNLVQAKDVSATNKTDMKTYVARFEDTFLKGLYRGIRVKRRDRAERIAAVTTSF